MSKLAPILETPLRRRAKPVRRRPRHPEAVMREPREVTSKPLPPQEWTIRIYTAMGRHDYSHKGDCASACHERERRLALTPGASHAWIETGTLRRS